MPSGHRRSTAPAASCKGRRSRLAEERGRGQQRSHPIQMPPRGPPPLLGPRLCRHANLGPRPAVPLQPTWPWGLPRGGVSQQLPRRRRQAERERRPCRGGRSRWARRPLLPPPPAARRPWPAGSTYWEGPVTFREGLWRAVQNKRPLCRHAHAMESWGRGMVSISPPVALHCIQPANQSLR